VGSATPQLIYNIFTSVHILYIPRWKK